MKTINWGIIGCGDVTEIKSGPAFNNVKNSSLVAVMRRNADKAKDYARRHKVPKWYSDAGRLINDPEVNAIYVATPPLSHEEYTIAALQSGKPVYVEKPMAVDAAAGIRMQKAALENNGKLTVAHYRRQQPMFKKIKELLDTTAIGEIRCAWLQFLQPPSLNLTEMQNSWRINPAISGGGLFHDLAPHQLDLMYYFFGKIKKAAGVSINQAGLYKADDAVCGQLLFENGTLFNGLWCFTVPPEKSRDHCEIIGSTGSLSFSVFGDPYITIMKNGGEEIIPFDKLQHVQQPMIEKTVEYFLDQAPNPCSAEEGIEVLKVMDAFTGK